nr:alpha/beta hydrolase [Wenjunlia vitaminophila]
MASVGPVDDARADEHETPGGGPGVRLGPVTDPVPAVEPGTGLGRDAVVDRADAAGPDAPGGAPDELPVVLESFPGFTLAVRRQPPLREGLPPAVLVHGLGGSSLNWVPLMRLLADAVHAEALDLPGFGHSPPPDDGDYSNDALARTVIRRLESSGRGPVHLFGNSLGGAVSVRVAALRPDLVRTLTLVSPALPELPPQHTALPTALVSVPGVPALFARATRGWTPERRVRLTVRTCYGDPSRVSEQALAAAAEEYRSWSALPYSWDAMTRALRGIVVTYTTGGARSLWRQAERVNVPVLLVYGVRDKLVAYRMARRACAAFSDARLLVLPDSGHVAMLEHPEAVSRGFRELLRTRQNKPSSGRS